MIAGISPRTSNRPHLVAVAMFDNVILTDLAIPCDVFQLAQLENGSPAYEVQVCAVGPVKAASPVNLNGSSIKLLRKADTIVVPGVSDPHSPVDELLLKELRRAIHRGARVASICTGAFILARTGALDGGKATTHWTFASDLAKCFPRITVDPDVLYVDNGQLLTSAGVAAGFDLCLHLIRKDCGAEIASRVARMWSCRSNALADRHSSSFTSRLTIPGHASRH
jgi:transcriptional regulator GlxA family with amidase domain